ncbi:MAG: hypothetical protein PHE84_03730 [bacterium]|nr:hypothetical protein [bacterium]
MKKRKISRRLFVGVLAIGFGLLLGILPACGGNFTPKSVINKLRILGIRADRPEICPFGSTACPEETYAQSVSVALLAADETGIVTDGLFPGGPFLKDGYQVEWGRCQYSDRIGQVEEPDCTQDVNARFAEHQPLLVIPGPEILAELVRIYGDLLGDINFSTFSPGESQDIVSQFGVEYVSQLLGAAVVSENDRDWGIKRIRLSVAERSKINLNPELTEVTINGIPIVPAGETQMAITPAESYRIGWKFPDSSWQEYISKTAGGEETRKEMLSLAVYATAGNFVDKDSNDDTEVNLWMQVEKENEIYWKAPAEIPADGWEATLVFKLMDFRGGCDWKWTKIRLP